MDMIFVLLGIVLGIILLRNTFKANREPEYIFVPVSSHQKRQSMGCLPSMIFLVLGILLLVLLRSGY